MLDRAGNSNELFRFSTTAIEWEQLDAVLVWGFPPSARSDPAMAAVGSDLFVFGGETVQGEEALLLLAAVWGHVRYGADDCSARCCCARAVAWSRAGCRAWRHQGLVVTRGAAQQLYPGTVSRSGHTDEHVHNVAHREPDSAPGVPCRGWCRHVTRGLTHVGACWTVQGSRTSSIGSRRRRFSGSSSMRLSSRASRPARDTNTPWLLWVATSSYSEERFQTGVSRHAALAGHRLGACQIWRRQLHRALLCCARAATWCRTRVPCLEAPGSGLVATRGAAHQLYAGFVSRSGHTDEQSDVAHREPSSGPGVPRRG